MVRVMRDSPPDDARAWAGPDASSRSTFWPALRRCHAVQAPRRPAPITIAFQPADAATAGAAGSASDRGPTADSAAAVTTPCRTSRRVRSVGLPMMGVILELERVAVVVGGQLDGGRCF